MRNYYLIIHRKNYFFFKKRNIKPVLPITQIVVLSFPRSKFTKANTKTSNYFKMTKPKKSCSVQLSHNPVMSHKDQKNT